LKVFYIGSAGPLSLQPFHYLQHAGYEICAVGVDRQQPVANRRQLLPMVTYEANALDALAVEHDIQVIDLRRPITEVAVAVQALQPELILVSCYAGKIADEILEIPRLGAFNIHPSLLPAFRGPVPLFWQFREGTGQFGLSLHRMTSRFDAGPVISSQPVEMPQGVSQNEATRQIAAQIDTLLNDGLPAVARGDTGGEQDEELASYQAFPEVTDFVVWTKWSAERIFNFMRATAHLGQSYACQIEGQDMQLRHALTYSSKTVSGFIVQQEDTIEITCSSGILLASYY